MNIDMPLDVLKEYMGKSPKPSDFDSYWERGLKEVEKQGVDYELIPADIQTDVVECYHLYFTGVGGARVYCKYVKPKNPKPNSPGLVMFHGYSVDSGDWSDKITYAAHGISVLAMDCRGQGGLSEDNLTVLGNTLRGHIIRGIDDPNPDNFYFRQVFLDTVQAARILMSMEHVDENRIGVFGMSQGGALATVCAALEPRVKMAICGYPFLSDYKRVWEMDINASAYAEIAEYFRKFDPHHEREDEIFLKLGYIDIQNFADRVKANVLWVTGMIDLICPPSSQFAAYNKITSEKELLLYHEFGHEGLPRLVDKALQRFLKL
ncbi:alpha/beta fold hydrolase [Litchfieldia alkalitelluris]|uniref:alpha/beta fold hydrolase n=1 Tax=Litchfieldia alkalitelluris TaxID=304268 RepID=UPI0009983038|nr:alpha/beta fold hydrolase [Litchfieldia alkalitelluris]